MNFCINCKWYDGDGYCTRWRWINPVDGSEESAAILARIERDSTTPIKVYTTPDPCGPAAKHFEQAAPKSTPLAPAKLPWWKRVFGKKKCA